MTTSMTSDTSGAGAAVEEGPAVHGVAPRRFPAAGPGRAPCARPALRPDGTANRIQPSPVPTFIGPEPLAPELPSLASIDVGLRRAVPAEAELISRLFVEAYGESTHPGRAPAFIRASMAAGDVWLVHRIGGRPVGCVCTSRLPWTGLYEVTSIVVTATEQGRSVGAALSAGARQVAASNPDCRVLVARLRSPIATYLAWRDPLIPLPPTGHDGGVEQAQRRHEVHLMSVNINRFSPPRRAALPLGSPVEELYRRLPWPVHPACELAPWPEDLVVVPHAADWWSSGFTGLLDPDNSTLPALAATSVDDGVREVSAWLAAHPGLRHVSAIVPADKLAFIAGLRPLGFAATAYLPTWYERDGVFFDCILLTRVVGGPADPVGQSEVIDEWDGCFDRLGLGRVLSGSR